MMKRQVSLGLGAWGIKVGFYYALCDSCPTKVDIISNNV